MAPNAEFFEADGSDSGAVKDDLLGLLKLRKCLARYTQSQKRWTWVQSLQKAEQKREKVM